MPPNLPPPPGAQSGEAPARPRAEPRLNHGRRPLRHAMSLRTLSFRRCCSPGHGREDHWPPVGKEGPASLPRDARGNSGIPRPPRPSEQTARAAPGDLFRASSLSSLAALRPQIVLKKSLNHQLCDAFPSSCPDSPVWGTAAQVLWTCGRGTHWCLAEEAHAGMFPGSSDLQFPKPTLALGSQRGQSPKLAAAPQSSPRRHELRHQPRLSGSGEALMGRHRGTGQG